MDLSGRLDALYERHLTHSEKIHWDYHDLLPWELGRTWRANPWTPQDGTLSPELILAVETALLTEVNLPWFTAGLTRGFAEAPPALKHFIRRWTAEEDQHSRTLEVFLLLTRNGDPVSRNRLRRDVLEIGWGLPAEDLLGIMVYTTIQELATRTFYQNLARVSQPQDPNLARVLHALARDETLHFAFYRDAVAAYLERDPNGLEAVCRVIPSFAMPGAGMPGFANRMHVVERCGGYGLDEYVRQVIRPLLEFWGVFEHQVSRAVEQDRLSLSHHVARLEQVADRSRRRSKSRG
jgi:acyl-[acyl-carrier-protein] desaturase